MAGESEVRSFRPMFQVHGDPGWYGNALRFATREAAEHNAREKWNLWTLCDAWRVDESADEPNWEYDEFGELREIKK